VNLDRTLIDISLESEHCVTPTLTLSGRDEADLSVIIPVAVRTFSDVTDLML